MTTTETRKAGAEAFAKKLEALLAEKKMSRRELARRWSVVSGASFDTARTSIARIFRADHLANETTRLEIAEALEVDPAELKEEALSGGPFRGRGSRRRADVAGRGTPEGRVAA